MPTYLSRWRIGRFLSRRGFLKDAALVLGGVTVAGLVVFLTACAPKQGTVPSLPSPGANEVWIIGWNYVPETITVPVGTTVTWTNTDRGFHTITSNDWLFDSPLGFGQSFSYSFTKPGTFDYHDAVTDPPIPGRVIVE